VSNGLARRRRTIGAVSASPPHSFLLSARPLARFVGIADQPLDDDDTRLRKRVGVVAGYLTVVAPLTLPIQAGGTPLSWALAIGLSAYAIANLVVLARSHKFDRFVVALLFAGVVFVPSATFLGGGITGSSAGLGWAFLVPAYAILALGPRRAAKWFVVYLGMIALMIAIDPIARAESPAQSYPVQLFGQVQNSVVPLTIVFLLLLYTDIRRRAAEARADELLTNAIPGPIASRLRRGERRIAESYASTTILFADIVGFTPWAQRTPPADVVALLDDMFTRFDELADRYGVEKVKTSGDAWMGVAGAPVARPDHAVAAVQLGQAMVAAVADIRASSGVELEVRVGVASGPVVGGVIGQRRLLFDLWGDTVNVAARMESTDIPGRIQIAESTRNLLPDDRFRVEARDVDVKGLGRRTVYLVQSG
jgi:adenylate cyclase